MILKIVQAIFIITIVLSGRVSVCILYSKQLSILCLRISNMINIYDITNLSIN